MHSYGQSETAAGPASRLIGAVFAIMFSTLTFLFVFAAFPTQSAEPATTNAVTPACAPARPFALIQLFA